MVSVGLGLIYCLSVRQMSLKAETEMAMKLLEKDIHDKQDTIVSLRRQLDDIKSINLDMYRKLQVGNLRFLASSSFLQLVFGVGFSHLTIRSRDDGTGLLYLHTNHNQNIHNKSRTK